MHLFPLMFALAGCGADPPAPAPATAASKAKKKTRPKPSKPAPRVDPDYSGIAPRKGELVGCPPEATYQTEVTPEETTAWCERAGERHGNWIRLGADGKKLEKGGFLDGGEEGQWITYHPTTEVHESRGTWDDGKRIGRWTRWHGNGKILEEGDYVNGRRVGMWVEYDEAGVRWKEGMYVNDLKDGRWMIFQTIGSGHTAPATPTGPPGAAEAVVNHVEVWERGILAGEGPPVTTPSAPLR